MRRDFGFLGTLALIFFFLFLSALFISGPRKVSESPPPACPATPRQLTSDPDLYEGRRVLILTGSFQLEADRRELAFRPVVPGPATVLVRFAGPVPDPVPPRVSGVCAGHGPVIVTDAKAE